MAQSCDRIVRNLRQRGVYIDLVHFTPRKSPYVWQDQQQGRYLACPFEVDAAHTLNKLYLFIEPYREQYTHLVAYGGNLPVRAAAVFPHWLVLPSVVLFRGNDLDAGIFSSKRQDVVYRAMEAASALGAVSTDKVIKLQRMVPGTPCLFTPNSIDADAFLPGKSQLRFAGKWKQEAAAGKMVIGFIGQLKVKKGIDFFLNCLAHLPFRKQLHLLFIGEIPDEIRLFLSEDITYTELPFIDRYELLQYYPACDAVAIPSWYDGMPNVLLEAAALGIPVLGSRVDGIRDVLQDDFNDFLFQPGRTDEARQALHNWYFYPDDKREAVREKLKATIREHYNPDIETTAMLNAMEATGNRKW